MEAVLPGPAAITLVSLTWDLARLEVRICTRMTGSNWGQNGYLIPFEMFT